MSIFKCKMCGGTLEINNNETVAVCEYCDSKQTLPNTSDDVLTNLYNRANNLRLKCEFDKASQVYEKIVQQDDSQSEAHWGIVLCKYGIEYVEDPKTLQRIPTCHRTLFEAVTTDADYLAAIDYSDSYQQVVYETEARAIDRIQKDILEIVKSEKPFDVFICYKETDEDGKRTVDSVIANDIYYQLTQEGFKVFYAAITLEDKLGQEYEPYIFAALNSSKVMLVLGTKPEYYSAVWVKNEWSRFMQLMRTNREKLLIPCYRDMDAYDLPEEFSHLQAQDMSKIGFINDVARGIRKVLSDKKSKETVAETVVVNAGSSVQPLLKRAFMFLEDGEWASADEYCEKVLDIDPENARAYLGKLMAELHVHKQDELADCKQLFYNKNNYKKALRFADNKFKKELADINICKMENEYQACVFDMDNAETEAEFLQAANRFETIDEFKDSKQLALKCTMRAKEIADEIFRQEESERKRLDKVAELTKKINILNRDAKEKEREFNDAQNKCKELKKEIVKIASTRRKLRVGLYVNLIGFVSQILFIIGASTAPLLVLSILLFISYIMLPLGLAIIIKNIPTSKEASIGILLGTLFLNITAFPYYPEAISYNPENSLRSEIQKLDQKMSRSLQDIENYEHRKALYNEELEQLQNSTNVG